MSQTPTDDQLGDQQSGADRAAGGADARTLRPMSAGAQAVFGPARAGGDLAANQHCSGCACPADQSASDAPQVAAGKPTVSDTAVHNWHAPTHAASSLSGSLAVGNSPAVPDAAHCRETQSDDKHKLTQHYPTRPLSTPVPDAELRAAPPVLPSKNRSARLADSDAGNLSTVVRSSYCVPSSSGSSVQRLAAPPLDVTVAGTTQNATALRRTFSRWVHSVIAADAADDLTVAVYEALTNAAEHAFTTHQTPGVIWLHAIVADGQITVTVIDNGSWRHPTNSGGYRGRGLPLIHQLTTEAQVAPSPYGTTVRLRRQLRAEHYDELISKMNTG